MADHLDVASQKDNIPKHPWEHVPPAQWEDWKWQLQNRLNSVEDFARFLNLTEDEIIGLSARGLFRVDVTPYFASLMDYNDPTCPIRAQVLPKAQELLPFEAAMADSLAEE